MTDREQLIEIAAAIGYPPESIEAPCNVLAHAVKALAENYQTVFSKLTEAGEAADAGLVAEREAAIVALRENGGTQVKQGLAASIAMTLRSMNATRKALIARAETAERKLEAADAGRIAPLFTPNELALIASVLSDAAQAAAESDEADCRDDAPLLRAVSKNAALAVPLGHQVTFTAEHQARLADAGRIALTQQLRELLTAAEGALVFLRCVEWNRATTENEAYDVEQALEAAIEKAEEAGPP